MCWNVGRPIRLWERCLWLINPFDHGLRLKMYRCLPYCSVQTSWKHGIAKREDRATHIRQTSSVQKQRGGVVATLYSFIILKISLEHNLHQKMLRLMTSHSTNTMCTRKLSESERKGRGWRSTRDYTHQDTHTHVYCAKQDYSTELQTRHTVHTCTCTEVVSSQETGH